MTEYKFVCRSEKDTRVFTLRASSVARATTKARREMQWAYHLERAYRRLGNRWLELA